MSEMEQGNILEVKDLTVKFLMDEGTVHAVNGVSFAVPSGRSIGIVGESGCGKTVSSYSITHLLPKTAQVSGEILFRERDGQVTNITKLTPDGKEMRRIRGQEISMVFQEPMSSLSPVHTICNQLSEAMIRFQGMTKRQARARSVELLQLVGIPYAERRVDEYPFQLSGGMRQRVMIAMALARNPRVLIADEPTTALDVTLQAQVLRLIQDLQTEFRLSLVLITHDLGVVAHMVDHVCIMYLGQIVESGPVKEIYDNPKHPYTKGLMNSIPKLRGLRGERVAPIPGSVPSAYTLQTGCPFCERCSLRTKRCTQGIPQRIQVGSEHYVCCYQYEPGEEGQDASNA